MTATDGAPRSMLIVMLTAIGDAVHVLPVVCALKRRWPECRITWVLQPGPARLIAGHPDVDEIIIFERRRGWRAFVAVTQQLRARRFDVLLDLQLSFKAGLISWLSGVPVRWGYDRARARDLNTLFTNRRIPPQPLRHVQDEFLEFVEALGAPAEPVEWRLGPWPGENALDEFFSGLDRPVVTLVIATSNPEKDWVPERWAELCDVVHDEFGLRAVLAGGRSDRELVTERVIMQHARHSPLSTLGMPLRDLVGLLAGSALVISLDTGPLHMAVALGRPVIALMGYNDPRRVGPYRRFHDLVIDAFSDPVESRPITRAHRTGRMPRIQVADVVAKVRLWEDRYRPAGE